MPKLVRFDWAAKYLLKNKANYDILEGFLSELLKMDIKIEAILESEGNKETENDKFNRVDLLVNTDKREKIIIEIQFSSQLDYLSRLLYGSSKVITEYMKEGSAYKEVCKVISVSILFFDFGDGEDYIYKGKTEFTGIHKHDKLKLTESEKNAYQGQIKDVTDIFPEYYLIKVNRFRERIKEKFDEWVYFLKTEQIKPGFKARGIQSALKKLDVLNLSEEKRSEYEAYQETLHFEASMVLSHFEKGKNEGRAEGKEEGRAEGKEEGRAEGKEEGRAEGKEKLLKVAKALKSKGISVKEIGKITGLSKDELNKSL